MTTDSQETEALIAAISSYSQADADGIMVTVSREACDKAADRLASLLAELRRYQLAVMPDEPEMKTRNITYDWRESWIDYALELRTIVARQAVELEDGKKDALNARRYCKLRTMRVEIHHDDGGQVFPDWLDKLADAALAREGK